jgi:hypothetical protein
MGVVCGGEGKRWGGGRDQVEAVIVFAWFLFRSAFCSDHFVS